MAVTSDVSEVERLSGTVASPCQTRTKSTRKRKSDDIGDNAVDEFPGCPEFTTSVRSEKLTVANCQEAFFDKHSPRGQSISPDESEGVPFKGNDRVLKPTKSFFDEDERVPYAVNNTASPPQTPRPYRQEFYKMSSSTSMQTPTPSHYCMGVASPLSVMLASTSTPTPSHYCTGAGSPLSVVDELFTGFYGCMPQWECALPWRDDSEDDYDDTKDNDDEEDDDDDGDWIIRRSVSRQDAESVREHLSFPKHLGKEYVSQPTAEESRRERNTPSISRAIRRTPSSRLTTLESDSRQKMPGSKMFRRTEINKVTEIHWDEKVLDTSTLERMARLSVN
eukprot:jgi/Psemu1/12676/gm1.12676_g